MKRCLDHGFIRSTCLLGFTSSADGTSGLALSSFCVVLSAGCVSRWSLPLATFGTLKVTELLVILNRPTRCTIMSEVRDTEGFKVLTVIVSDLEKVLAGPVQLDGSQNIIFLVQRHGSLVESGQAIYMVAPANS
jgi:hypothetical protein